MSDDLAELASAYRSTAVAWDVMRNDSAKANPLFVQLHTIYKRLRDTQAGRDAIAALMDDENVGVRISAAAHSLAWAPEKATTMLEQIERDGPGLYRTTAKYTLKSFREGKLNLDW
jgi:hypothetical protein